MSAIIDPIDRTTAVLFGDGAGAVLLEPAEPGFGVLDFVHRVDGSGADDLYMLAGGSRGPASAETVAAREHYLRQNGRAVFKFAVTRHGRLHRGAARAPPADARRPRGGRFRTRPTSASSTPRPTGWGSRGSGWCR